MKNLTNFTFDPGASVGTVLHTDFHPNAIVTVDLDGDGKPDIATANNFGLTGLPGSISIIRNISTRAKPAFAASFPLATGWYTNTIAAGDLDGDGKPDLVSTSIQDQTLSVFRNSSAPGAIGFAPKMDIKLTYSPESIAVADLDGDGKPDVIVGTSGGGLEVFRNTSTGGAISFAPEIQSLSLGDETSIATGDVDGDGKTDLVVANNLFSTIAIFRNTSSPGAISFATRIDKTISTVGDYAFGVTLSDLDGDGKADLLVSNNNLPQSIQAHFSFSVYRNISSPGNAAFDAGHNYNSLGGVSNAYNIITSDLNGDGKPDVAVGIAGPFVGSLAVFQNTSTPGSISLAPNISLGGASANAVAIADLDIDGYPDIAVTDFTSDDVVIHHNRINEPTIMSATPLTGGPGDVITLTGVNFTGVTSVTFDGIPAASFAVVGDTMITATLGVGASGYIAVSSPKGTSQWPSSFTFAGPPIVSSFSPTSAGFGQTIWIAGHNFNNLTSVAIGGVQSNFAYVNADTITATIGSGASGDVKVTNQYGSGSVPGFTWVPLPFINGFNPAAAGQGVNVTITGIHFDSTTAVSFGGVPAASYTVVNADTIIAKPGPGASGPVTVTTVNGTASAPGFTILPSPTLTSFSPAYGINGTVLTLTGQNLGNLISLNVGGADYSSGSQWMSPTTILVTLDDRTNSGDIVFTGFGGTAVIHGFQYYHRPAFGSITPNIAGPGMTVTITGANFTGVSSVTLGGVPAASYTVVNPTTITAVVGTGASGGVVITNPAGSTFNNPVFTYTTAPQLYSYTPDSGPPGTVVTITGSNFHNDDVVWFGGVKAIPTAVTAGSITVAVPVGAANGPVVVTSPSFNQSSYLDRPFLITFPTDPTAFNAMSFAGHREFAAGERPFDVASGDLDGDGKPDLAVANFSSGSVTLFRNNSTFGTISFDARIDLPAGVTGLANIAIADVDGDGLPDIIAGRGNDDNCGGCGGTGIVIFRNTSTSGKLSFDQPVFISTYSHRLDFMVVGDIDRDGKPDIVGADRTIAIGESLYFFQNTSKPGAISFTETDSYVTIDPYNFTEAIVWGLALRDLNNDGAPDLIIGTAGADYLILAKNSNIYGDMIMGQTNIGGSYYQIYDRSYPLIADFDRDGNADIATNGSLLHNTGSFTFQTYRLTTTGGSAYSADLNGDGYPDIVHDALTPGDSAIYLYKDTLIGGAINFVAGAHYPVLLSGDRRIIAVDLDGDAKPEIVVTNKRANSISVLRNRIGEPTPAAPVLTGFTPNRGGQGTQLTITGSNFGQATAVTIGGTPVAGFTVINDDTIRAVVDTGVTGQVVVTTPGGSAGLDAFSFIPSSLPHINFISPAVGVAGSTITLTGVNFTGTTAVNFGSTAARSFTIQSSSTILAVVDTATNDSVSVTNTAGSAAIGGFRFVPTPRISGNSPDSLCAGSRMMLHAGPADGADGYQWFVNGTTVPAVSGDSLEVDSTGTYTVNQTILGVASSISQPMVIVFHPMPAQPVITQVGDSLVSSAATGNQWYTDSTTAIDSANGQVYQPKQKGSYSVRVTTNGCTGPYSALFDFTPPATSTSIPNVINVGPNPAGDHIVISFDIPGVNTVTVMIFDVNGKQYSTTSDVHNQQSVDIAGLSPGLYFVRIFGPDGKSLKTVKIYKLH